jgi:hypothetical protein
VARSGRGRGELETRDGLRLKRPGDRHGDLGTRRGEQDCYSPC